MIFNLLFLLVVVSVSHLFKNNWLILSERKFFAWLQNWRREEKWLTLVFIHSQKIAKNVNADEAAVLGAAFRGATLSTQFRLSKQISIKDVTLFPVEVSYKPENKGKEAKSAVTTTLFEKFGPIGTRKIMTFNRDTDFEFEIAYGKDAYAGLGSIAKVKVTGLTEALKKHKDDIKASEIPPKVRVTFELSNSGIISVPEATLQIGKLTFKGKHS